MSQTLKENGGIEVRSFNALEHTCSILEVIPRICQLHYFISFSSVWRKQNSYMFGSPKGGPTPFESVCNLVSTVGCSWVALSSTPFRLQCFIFIVLKC